MLTKEYQINPSTDKIKYVIEEVYSQILNKEAITPVYTEIINIIEDELEIILQSLHVELLMSLVNEIKWTYPKLLLKNSKVLLRNSLLHVHIGQLWTEKVSTLYSH